MIATASVRSPWRRAGRRYISLTLITVALIAAACSDDDDANRGVTTAPPAGAATAAPASGGGGTAADGGGAATAGFAAGDLIEGAGAYDWRVTLVADGTKPGIALDAAGHPLIAYMLERVGAAGWVRVATGNGAGFEVSEVQSGYMYGPLDIAVAADGTPVVAYHNHDWEDAAVAFGTGGGWEVTRVVDGGHDGWDSALALDAAGGVHLLGIDPAQFGSQNGVEYATRNGDAWTVQAIGSGPQPYEWGTDIAVDAAGTLHAVFFDARASDLVYGRNDGSGWTVETIYEAGDAGRFASLALDASGAPHVAFLQSDGAIPETGRSSANVVYGALGEGGWSFETVGRLDALVTAFEGARRSVALSIGEAGPVVAFIDDTTLSLASRSGGEWSSETILTAGGDPLQIVGLALDAAGRPHLTFATTTGNGPLSGQVWYLAPVPKA